MAKAKTKPTKAKPKKAKAAPKPRQAKPVKKAITTSAAKRVAATESFATITPVGVKKPEPNLLASSSSGSIPIMASASSGSLPIIGARGEELVERVIARIEASGGILSGCGIPDHPASGLDPHTLANLTLPGGRPLPPSLATFLAYDATHLGVLEGQPPKLAFRSFYEMMAEQFDERTADIFSDFANLLPGQCLVLPEGSDSRRFMYVGEPDEHGEYPVLLVDTDDIPFVCVAYPGLDVYLADGVTDVIINETYTDCFDHPKYGDDVADQARRNFRGFMCLDFGGDTEHLDGETAAQGLLESLFGA